MPFLPIFSDPRLVAPKPPKRDYVAASRLTFQAPEKDFVIEKDPRFNDAIRIDGILVSTEALLHIFRPNPDPRMWSRFDRTPSPTHPGEDVITVHVETREG